MKIRMTRAKGLAQGSLESLLLAAGVKTCRENPYDDRTLIVTAPETVVNKIRAMRYQPHGIQILEPDSPPPSPLLYTQEQYDQGIEQAFAQGVEQAGGRQQGKRKDKSGQ